jgi:polysaccharide biosynthesis protein PelG
MAGIGFILRKLANQDNFSGILRAYFHSAVVSAGPWILVVVSLGMVTYLTGNVVGLRELNDFLAIVVYNFFFSFILSSPLYMISARYVSDCLYGRSLSPIPGVLITSLFYMVIPCVIFGGIFYTFYATMLTFTIILSVVNFALLAQIWIVMLYLSSIRNFRAITLSWIIGTIITIFLANNLGHAYGSTGLLVGFNIGLVFLLFSLIAQTFAEYPFRFKRAKEFGFYFKNYNGLFCSGFFLFAGMWIDKVIMWFAKEGVTHLNGLRTYPVYDGAMFFSYLTIIPVLALFIFSLETNFYDSYIQYIQDIEKNAPYSVIQEEKKNIFSKISQNSRNFFILQGCVTIVAIGLAPKIFESMGLNFVQFGIFRIGTLGAFFSSMNFFIVILFSYFDNQQNMLRITATMFITNVVFTIISLKLGFSYYGMGFCLSMIVSFLVGGILLVRFLNKLTYHIFITNVVKRQHIAQLYQKRFEKEL